MIASHRQKALVYLSSLYSITPVGFFCLRGPLTSGQVNKPYSTSTCENTRRYRSDLKQIYIEQKKHPGQLEFSSIWIRMFQSNKKKIDIVFQLTSQPSAGLDVLAEFEASHESERRVDSHHWSLVCARPCHVKLPLCI